MVLIFSRQPSDLKRGWTDNLRDSISFFFLIGMKRIAQVEPSVISVSSPPMNQLFKYFWVHRSIQNSVKETVIGKGTNLLPSLVL